MKNLTLTIFAVFALATAAWAQDSIEVIYLQNGTVLKGTIIENIAGQYITIKTLSGEVQRCTSSDIRRIEQKTATSTQARKLTHISDTPTIKPPKQPSKYQGFVEVGYGTTIGGRNTACTDCSEIFGQSRKINQYGCLEFTTSHGAIRRNVFVGGGAGVAYFAETGGGIVCAPIYFNLRFYNYDKKITPMLDIKLGTCISEIVPGIFSSLHAGVNFGRFNIAAGASLYVIIPARTMLSVGGRVGVRF